MAIDSELLASMRASMEWTEAALFNNFATTVGLPVLPQADAAAMTRAARDRKVARIHAEIEATDAV